LTANWPPLMRRRKKRSGRLENLKSGGREKKRSESSDSVLRGEGRKGGIKKPLSTDRQTYIFGINRKKGKKKKKRLFGAVQPLYIGDLAKKRKKRKGGGRDRLPLSRAGEKREKKGLAYFSVSGAVGKGKEGPKDWKEKGKRKTAHRGE